jgi:hypothetical protein
MKNHSGIFLLFFFYPVVTFAQETVTGRAADAVRCSKATVVQGTKIGATTNENGNFTISVPLQENSCYYSIGCSLRRSYKWKNCN